MLSKQIKKHFYHTFSEVNPSKMISFISSFGDSLRASDPQSYAETLTAMDANIQKLQGWILKGIEIFKSGTYRGLEYSNDDLDQMVNNFKILKDDKLFDPVFKKDHSESIEDQIGWILNCYREGDLLKADIHLTDWRSFDKIQEGTWKNLSSEIYPPDLATEEFGDSVDGYVLRGVAIVSIPKVKGLQGLILNSEILENQEEGNTLDKEKLLAMLAKQGITFSEQEAADLTIEQLVGKLTAKFAELQAAQSTPPAAGAGETGAVAGAGQVVFTATEFVNLSKQFSEMDSKVQSFTETINQLKGTAKKAGIDKKIEDLMKVGKVTPAEKEAVMAFAEKLDDAAAESYFATFEKRTPVVTFGEHGSHGSDDDDAETDAALKALNNRKIYE